MSTVAESAFTAFRVADRLKPRSQPPWEVFGERLRRYEVHLNGARVEMLRAPVELEGYGLRVFRRADDQMGVGFAASTDLRDAGVEAAVLAAEGGARYARFPARRVELPGSAGGPAEVEIVDPQLWERPVESVERYVEALLAPFEGRRDEQPSFGSVRATLIETTLANSEGIQRRYHHTMLELEIAIKATGGPEGAAPGEYWVNQRHRRVPEDATVRAQADRWIHLAQDVRRAQGPTTGPTRVVLPTSVLSDILPAIVGFRLSGSARLRKMMPPMGSQVGSPEVTILDDGLIAHAIGTAPFDDEGVGQSRRPLVEAGLASGSIYDLLHASALGEPTGGNGRRDSALFPA
ncbi:MAG TPA: metallopeptidase TldD-related protein, partial [Thermoplasmata archaeon]